MKMFRVLYVLVVYGGCVQLCFGTLVDRVPVDTNAIKENNDHKPYQNHPQTPSYRSHYYLPPSYEGESEYNPHGTPEHYPPPYYEETNHYHHGGYGFHPNPGHQQSFRSPSQGNSHNSFGGLALKGLLIPLAGIALLGAAAALSTNPILLQLGVISGRRRRRSTTGNERKSLPSRRA